MSDSIGPLNEALEGRYRIERELGSGGMATVYLADDLRHERKVALKVLRPELAAVMGAERFLAEIKTTANLQHPNILPLFDSGEAGGFLFYVMPYVEGESLREKLDREGQLPVDEAVTIARDVAEALQAAHDHGVIHRDIKPANILLSRGRPLVADFGIALAVSAAGGGRLTETGLSMGTPFYMSPEQASADREPTTASDVYSLGCVLYEMLVGEPPYTGKSAQAVLAKILTEDPAPSTSRRSSIPRNVDAAIRKALERLPADRFARVDDLARALSDPGFRHGADAAGAAGDAGPWRRRAAMATAAAVVFATSTAAALAWGLTRAPEPPEPVRSYLMLPDGAYLGAGNNIRFSADGRVVFVSALTESGPVLLQRSLDGMEFAVLEGSEGGTLGAESPDGRFFAFRAGQRISSVSLDGGQMTTLVQDVTPMGIDWGSDGALYYSKSYNEGLWRLPDGASAPVRLTARDTSLNELGHWWPQLLPDGDHVLFTVFHTPVDSSRIAIVSISTGDVTTVLPGAFSASYSPTGHLLFARGDALYAVRFDERRLTVEGEPELLVDDVAVYAASGVAAYGLSPTGTLVFARVEDAYTSSEVVSVDRLTGEETALPLPPGIYETPALSPDGGSLAIAIRRPGTQRDVATFDLARADRPSFLAQSGREEFGPIWTADGRTVVYVCESPIFDLCSRLPNSAESERKIWSSEEDKIPSMFHADRGQVVFRENSEGGVGTSLMAIAVDDPNAQPDTLISLQGDVRNPQLSPDGRWVAYTTTDQGSEGVWLQEIGGSSRQYQVSDRPRGVPRWTKGGRELVYWGSTENPGISAVLIDPVTGRPGQPVLLFDDAPYEPFLDVTPDGERFIMLKEVEGESAGRLVMVQNFFTELERLLPN